MAVSQKAFFGKKGGITFSGGEPTLQAEALIPLFKDLKANGIHICLDTNGGIWNDKVEELLSLTDLVLLDIKEFNPERHRTPDRTQQRTNPAHRCLAGTTGTSVLAALCPGTGI